MNHGHYWIEEDKEQGALKLMLNDGLCQAWLFANIRGDGHKREIINTWQIEMTVYGHKPWNDGKLKDVYASDKTAARNMARMIGWTLKSLGGGWVEVWDGITRHRLQGWTAVYVELARMFISLKRPYPTTKDRGRIGLEKWIEEYGKSRVKTAR